MGDVVLLEVKKHRNFGDGRRRTGYLVEDKSHGDETAWIDQDTARDRCWARCVLSNFGWVRRAVLGAYVRNGCGFGT